jgi:hypothetical protein
VALTKTLLQMRTSARLRAAMENTLFVTDAEVTEYINYGLQRVYGKLVKARVGNFFRSKQTITTVNNTSAYALAADFFELLSVDVQLSTGSNPITICATEYTEAERNRFQWYPGWTYNLPVYFQLQGSNINFIPTPSGAFTVLLNYAPAFVPLAANGDQFDGVNGWEEYAVWYAVKTMLAKEESDVSVAMSEMAALEQDINDQAADRDAGTAPRVIDVYEQDGGVWGGGYD